MLDILLYLFDTYRHTELAPPRDKLARKLTAAGYDEPSSANALDWFERYAGMNHPADAGDCGSRGSFRCYAAPELERLDAGCRGYIGFLESAGMLSAAQRERVIEGLLVLDEDEILIEHVKWVAMLVLWGQNGSDTLLSAEEALLDDEYALPN